MRLGTAQVVRADSRHLPIADDSVDLVVTSPPYFALRSYQDGGKHYERQIGSEPTPDEFVSSLLEVTRECMRVLKPSGSLWVNLGDKYAGVGGSNGFDWCIDSESTKERRAKTETKLHKGRNAGGVKSKSLFGIPWRYALRCIDELGLILRAEVIWSKPNGLPESVTDRVRRSHEQWFHFTLQPRYFSAVDEIREATDYKGRTWDERKASGVTWTPGIGTRGTHLANEAAPNSDMAPHALGRLPGSVWTVPTEPLRVPEHLGIDHFAAFPTEWPKRIIQGWSPDYDPDECSECLLLTHTCEERAEGCCPYCTHGTARPAVVLDPFGGTGTTAMVAKALGRHGISVDMSADYCRLAEWRTNDRDQLAKVLGIAKAEQQDDDQLSIFDYEETA